MKIVATLVILFITIPIWFYLLYRILVMVNATELMWFLYWAYLPFSLFAHVVMKTLDAARGKNSGDETMKLKR